MRSLLRSPALPDPETTEEPNDAALRAEVGARLAGYLTWLDAARQAR
jgi:hypothetical protein